MCDETFLFVLGGYRRSPGGPPLRVVIEDSLHVSDKHFRISGVVVCTGRHYISFIRQGAVWIEYDDLVTRVHRALPTHVAFFATTLMLEIVVPQSDLIRSEAWDAFCKSAAQHKLVGFRNSAYAVQHMATVQLDLPGISDSTAQQLLVCLHSFFIVDFSWHTAAFQHKGSDFQALSDCVKKLCKSPAAPHGTELQTASDFYNMFQSVCVRLLVHLWKNSQATCTQALAYRNLFYLNRYGQARL